MKTVQIESFVKSYLYTAEWLFIDNEIGGDPEFSTEARETAKKDCQQFIDSVLDHFGKEKGMELMTTEGSDLAYLAAHDFYLTRNGHGSGFWDKENYYGEKEADILTHLAVKMGENNVYLSDANELEFI